MIGNLFKINPPNPHSIMNYENTATFAAKMDAQLSMNLHLMMVILSA